MSVSATAIGTATGMSGIVGGAAGGASGPPALESWTETIQATTAGSITSSSYPADIASGDVLLLFCMNDEVNLSAHNFNAVAGWTLLGGATHAAADCQVGVYYKVADGSETNVTVTWTNSVTNGSILYYLRCSGINATPVDVSNFAADSTGGQSTHVIPAITTTVDGCLCFYGLATDGGDLFPFSVSGGTDTWVEQDEGQTITSGSGTAACFGVMTLTSTGTTGAASVLCSGTDGASYFQLALAPA